MLNRISCSILCSIFMYHNVCSARVFECFYLLSFVGKGQRSKGYKVVGLFFISFDVFFYVIPKKWIVILMIYATIDVILHYTRKTHTLLKKYHLRRSSFSGKNKLIKMHLLKSAALLVLLQTFLLPWFTNKYF